MFPDPGQQGMRQAQQENQRQANQRFSDFRPPRPGGCLSFLILAVLVLTALGWASAHGYTPAAIIRDIQHFASTTAAPGAQGSGSGS
jgi:hypothetical protein